MIIENAVLPIIQGVALNVTIRRFGHDASSVNHSKSNEMIYFTLAGHKLLYYMLMTFL